METNYEPNTNKHTNPIIYKPTNAQTNIISHRHINIQTEGKYKNKMEVTKKKQTKQYKINSGLFV